MQLKNKFNYAKSTLHSTKEGAHGNYFNCMHFTERVQKVGKNRGRKTRANRNEHFEKTLWWGRVAGAESSGTLRTQPVEPPRTFRTDVRGHLNEVLTDGPAFRPG